MVQCTDASLHQKTETESIQCDACLAITVATRDSTRGKIYQKLRLKSLQHRRCYRKLCWFKS